MATTSKFKQTSFEYTFGQPSISVSWTRSSSKYTHTLRFYVMDDWGEWNYIHVSTNLTTSKTITFTQTELNKMIDGTSLSSTDAKFILYTYNGSTLIGSETLEGQYTLPARSTIQAGQSNSGTYRLGQTYTLVQEPASTKGLWNMDIRVKEGSSVNSNEIDYIEPFKNSKNWTPQIDDFNYLFTGNKTSVTAYFHIDSEYHGNIIRWETLVKPITLLAPLTPPAWQGSTPFIRDINSTSTTLTGDSTKIIQTLSTLKLTIPVGSAVAKDGATLAKYRVYVGSKYIGEYTNVTSTIEVTLGAFDLQGNQTINIHAVDNRGNSSVKALTIYFVPYQKPLVTTDNIGRLNGYLGTILASALISYSPVAVNGINKNALNSVRLDYRVKGVSSWTSAGTFTGTTNKGIFTSNQKQITGLSEEATYEVRIMVTDTIGNSTNIIRTIGQGVPLIYFDKKNLAIGMGKFPSKANVLDTNYPIITPSGLWGHAGKFGIDMQNSDIINANQIFFNDASDSINEGIHFPRSSAVRETTTGVFPSDQMDSLKALDGKLIMNSDYIPVIESGTINIKGTTADAQGNYSHQASVTFSKPFIEVPSIMIMANTTVPGSTQLGEGVSGITINGFTVNGARKNTTETAYKWVALGFRL